MRLNFPLTVFRVNFAMRMKHCDSNNMKTFMDILRPIIRINQILGVCPLEISGYNIKFRLKSFKTAHTVVTLLVLISYFTYSLYQFSCSFGRGRSVPEIVSMATWVAGTLIPVAMLILTILKRDQFSHFFEKSNEFRIPLKGLIKYEETVHYSRNLFIVYIFLTFGSCLFVALDAVRKPTGDIFILAYTTNPSSTWIAISCTFQCYLVIVKSCGCAFIEVLCCCIGASFQYTVNAIIEELHESVGVSSPCETLPNKRKHKSSMDQNDQIIPFQNSPNLNNRKSLVDILNFRVPIPNSKSYTADFASYPQFGYSSHPWPNGNYRRNHQDDVNVIRNSEYNEFYSSTEEITSCSSTSSGESCGENIDSENTGPIIKAIKKFNCITSMQTLLNSIFGPILALDIGLLVLLSCLLLYLKINFLGSGSVDYIDGFTFTGNCILYFARLVIVFVSLGNVHEKSLHFNECLTASLMHVKCPKHTEVNLVLAHLTSQFANPSCFSGAGFFIFSRGSLLAVLSAIMTYVVFLLQAKM
ncbi:unnamed protein product [Orchesella dallaii]|uniref:Gustatory receptor n=1 Tax=Orchesella dallaii TaxID=48710 RepID=A0ABP1PQS4_9HEXA